MGQSQFPFLAVVCPLQNSVGVKEVLPSDGSRLEASKHGEVREDKSGRERSIRVSTTTDALLVREMLVLLHKNDFLRV